MRALLVAGSIALAATAAAAEPSPWLGITYQGDRAGAVVREVHPGSAAAAVGLRPGDVIAEIGGIRVSSDLGPVINRFRIGERPVLLVARDGRYLRVAPRLRARPTADEMVHLRLVGHDLPDVVDGDDWRGRPLAIALYDARCEPCATAVTALVDRFAAEGNDVAIEAWVLAGDEELSAYLARVPLPVTTRGVERDRGTSLLGALDLGAEGALVVVDRGGTIRYAASTSSGELAHDGACRVAARVGADGRGSR